MCVYFLSFQTDSFNQIANLDIENKMAVTESKDVAQLEKRRYNTEKKRRYRERLQQKLLAAGPEHLAAYRRKEALRKNKSRQRYRESMTEEQRIRNRESNRKRVQAYRERVKQKGLLKTSLQPSPDAQEKYLKATKSGMKLSTSTQGQDEICTGNCEGQNQKEEYKVDVTDAGESGEEITEFVIKIEPEDMS